MYVATSGAPKKVSPSPVNPASVWISINRRFGNSSRMTVSIWVMRIGQTSIKAPRAARQTAASGGRNTKSVHNRGKPVYGAMLEAALSSHIHREVSNDNRDDTGASRAEGILRRAGLHSASGPADPG